MSLIRSKTRKSYKKSDISRPLHFEHRIHADFDPTSGEIRGLPLQWKAFLGADFYCRRQTRAFDEKHHQNSTSSGSGTSYSTNNSVATNGPALTTLNGQQKNKLAINGGNFKDSDGIRKSSRSDDDNFRNALLAIVDKEGDPQKDFAEFIKIGEGSSGIVYKAFWKSRQRIVAIKSMNIWRQTRRELLFNEVLVMRELVHPNLVQVTGSFLVDDQLWVVSEFMEHGPLTRIVTRRRMDEPLMATVCKQCLEALAFIHSRSIVHRDVKSDSILIGADGVVKLSDFGFCGQLSSDAPFRRSLLGTPYWLSNQVASREPYGTDADIWSFGITVIEMVFGEPPFFNEPPEVAMRKIVEMPATRFPPSANVSPQLDSFVSRMLVKSQQDRAGAIELLRHPFLYKAKLPCAILPLIASLRQPNS